MNKRFEVDYKYEEDDEWRTTTFPTKAEAEEFHDEEELFEVSEIREVRI